MQRYRAADLQQLKAGSQRQERLDFAKSLGNFQVEPRLLQQAIVRTARGFLQKRALPTAELDQLAALPPPARRGMPTTGKVRLFALLIEFSDQPHSIAASTLNDALFGAPASGAPYESLAAYYSRASYGKLDLSGGSTLGWYRANSRRADVAMTTQGREGLIKEALQYFDASGHNFAQYDNNGDGVIDYFLVFWTGPDNGWANFWWGYQTSFSDTSFKVDGVRLGKYSWQWESNPVGSAFDPRVPIHETGHALGLPDLYDYDDNQGPRGGVGGLDMMDANQHDHNAFSKWMLDWLTPRIITGGEQTLSLGPSGSTGDCVVVWPWLLSGSAFSEMFLVQNRQRVGNDSSLPAQGLVIWHIDARLNASGTDFAYNNSYTAHKLVRLMEADGREDIEVNEGADATDFYGPGSSFSPTTTPSSAGYDGVSSLVSVRNISMTGGQVTATFRVDLPSLNVPVACVEFNVNDMLAQGGSVCDVFVPTGSPSSMILVTGGAIDPSATVSPWHATRHQTYFLCQPYLQDNTWGVRCRINFVADDPPRGHVVRFTLAQVGAQRFDRPLHTKSVP